MTDGSDVRSEVTEAMLDAVFDALADAGMEVVYVEHREVALPIYSEACSDAREPMREGLRRVLSDITALPSDN